jgi:hypothetical protein
VFSGNGLEKCSLFVTIDPDDAHKLDTALPNREEARIQYKTGEAQEVGYQSSKSARLNLVGDDWSRYMYGTALDWKHLNYPDEVAMRLVDVADKEVEDKGKWINQMKFGEEWNM